MIRAITASVMLMAWAAIAQTPADDWASGIDQKGQVTKGLVAYWSMRHSGTTVYDEIGSNDGTATNDVAFAYTNGVVGQGAWFDGSGDNIHTPINGTEYSALTISYWARYDAIGPGSQTMFALDNSPGTVGLICGLKVINSSSALCGVYYQVAGLKSVSPTIPDVSWHHWVCVYTDARVEVFRDGITAAHLTFASDTFTASAFTMTIGSGYENANYFRGAIDEVRVYNRAISDAEVAQLYRMGKTIYQNR